MVGQVKRSTVEEGEVCQAVAERSKATMKKIYFK